MPYQTLSEHPAEVTEYEGEIFSKFCSYGFVTSRTWNSTYLVIRDSCLRLYDSKDTAEREPNNFVLELWLKEYKYGASIVKAKNYSQVEFKELMIHCVYLEVSNGFWAATRVLKIGAFDKRVIQKIREAIVVLSES